jgi:hypothetical protein
MGTRSSIRVISKSTDKETGKVYTAKHMLLYNQMDGYPEGHTLEAAKWLASGKVVNGFGLGETELVFNGAGCLAAQLVAHYKKGTGGAYLEPLSSRGKSWENYLYDIIVDEDTHTLELVAFENCNKSRPKEIFRGTPAQFVAKYEKVTA